MIDEETQQLLYHVPSHKMIDNEVPLPFSLTSENK
jgi:hypothetical protein